MVRHARRDGFPGKKMGTLQGFPSSTIQMSLGDSVFGCLDRAGLDDLAGRLGLEDGCFLGEGVDSLALLGGGLLDDKHADQAGNDEESVLLQLGLPDGCLLYTSPSPRD